MKKEPLYIFVHIPKTAGLTFRYHIRKNLDEDEYLLLAHTLFGLKSYPPPDHEEHKNKVFKYISNLEPKKKDKLKIIFGHYVPYGIHQHFDRPHRYITFVRDPIKRVISDYNYKVMKYNKAINKGLDHEYIDRGLLLNEQIPSFENWFKHFYSTNRVFSTPTMNEFLENLGYGKTIEEKINKFCFVGLTKTFNDDLLYLSSKIGINKFFLSKNKSKKYFKLGENKNIRRKIEEKNKKDYLLYDLAQNKHLKFIKDNPKYSIIIRKIKLKRKLILPLSQIIFAPKDTLKRISSYRLI